MSLSATQTTQPLERQQQSDLEEGFPHDRKSFMLQGWNSAGGFHTAAEKGAVASRGCNPELPPANPHHDSLAPQPRRTTSAAAHPSEDVPGDDASPSCSPMAGLLVTPDLDVLGVLFKAVIVCESW